MKTKEHGECYHKTQLLIFLFSLLLHFLILLLLFYVYQAAYYSGGKPQHDRSSQLVSINKQSPVLLFEKEKSDDFQWASTNPSNITRFGTESRVAELPPIESPEVIQYEAENIPDIQELLEQVEETSSTLDTKIPEPIETTSQESESISNNSASTIIDKAIATRLVEHTDAILQQPKTQKVSAQAEPATVQKQKKITKTTARKPVSPKAQQLMARIASSFMHEARDEQAHVVSIIGDPNKMPTAEQIKREQYLAKLQHCFYTSHSTLRSHMPRVHEKPINPIISIKVQRDGSASSICMLKSSNNSELDQFYMLVFQDASRSFPPLPNYFPLSYYIFQWLIVLS